MIKYSFIIPMYNSEATIVRCLNSILKSFYSEIEIILINDESTDDTLTICKEYAKKNPNLIIIDKKNEGQGVARNVGLERASGEYVLFMDSDDFLENDAIEKIDMMIKRKSADFYIANWKKVYEDKTIINSRKNKLIEYLKDDKYFIDNMLYPYKGDSFGSAVWGKVYKSKILKANNIKFKSEREYFSEDLLFNIDYLKCISNVIVSDEVIYNYVQNSNSYKNKYYKEYFHRMKKMCRYFDDLQKDVAFQNNKRIYIRIFEYLKICIKNEVKFVNYIGPQKAIMNIKNYCNDKEVTEKIVNIDNEVNGFDKIISFLVKYRLYALLYLVYKIYFLAKCE